MEQVDMCRLKSRAVIVATFLLVCVTASDELSAQEARSGGGSANAALLQQLQQLASERTDLQAQITKLQKDLEAMRRERDTVKSGQAAADRRAQQSESAVHQIQQDAAGRQKTADDNLARSKAQLDQLIAKFRELAQTLRDTETERTTMQQKLATQEHATSVCTDDNASLYNLNTEVLDHFEHSGLAGLLRPEPFTKIARTRLDNTVLEYKQRAQELRVQTAQANAAKRAGT
jgi:chromosome segregation ATPase